MIGAAQAVEHYEIARYGTLCEWAKVLGHDEAHNLLTSILDEEKAADSKLSVTPAASHTRVLAGTGITPSAPGSAAPEPRDRSAP